ncbi:MAG: hypothetical protein R3C11_16345 [Planctomycetaceae bacterium]
MSAVVNDYGDKQIMPNKPQPPSKSKKSPGPSDIFIALIKI